ncbi:LysR family transcriptional regulator, nitrogen assimilation regulatory protein [Variovorax sp. HW608]|uniref:nitrogen assimilation transcriptional regulator NAC n=1 Tax=Variovorax sp. HW608 TaxID=1034889 RepID=UPI00081F94FE|nr:nitrogen assimilation transcriptional regulator NAC [Variovorax sp. HW608]SCK30076.1 LysR family transcriptional regulator, nitrogen assimilation regulatory protein [Variovorax sp. HW608]
MNLRRLKYFVKIVDLGSLTLASEVLHVAQPALSQQLATLEHECKQKLLVRTQKGVVPTEAGRVLYRHAQSILRQIEQARADVQNAGRSLVGQVSVGLAPGTAASTLALKLLQVVQSRHPKIVLHINENFGTTLFDAVRSGLMDMAVLYGGEGGVEGLRFDALLKEPLCVVAPAGLLPRDDELALSDLGEVDLLLPCSSNQLRRYVDRAFAAVKVVPHVVAEMESSTTLAAAISSGVGATILPASIARTVADTAAAELYPLTAPSVEVSLVLCAAAHLPMSEPAQVVKGVLLELVEAFHAKGAPVPSDKATA